MTDKRMIAVFHYDNGRYGSEPYKYEELKRGKWVWGNEKKSWHKCSVCGESAYSYYDELDDDVEELFDYCPYCGADMKVEQTEPMTSGVVWTEDAIKNEPTSYSTWASTELRGKSNESTNK